ncbi:unnamed protein product [Triticum turgidum subsp. durum]|uniref:Tail specific protease domain-containing protein n=1 Tax=Triticum turgidum subsp. durum TaxID=4567 RepID=A0A9R1QIL5_TRITD|nr:unnamed protein product [Triticum turgidum subsp. durum]
MSIPAVTNRLIVCPFSYVTQVSMILQGLIQSVFELHDGSGIVVTVGKYVTPNHKDINGDGIEPDYRRLPGAVHVHQIFILLHLTCNVLYYFG